MFKLKVKYLNKSDCLDMLSLVEEETYKYVLADDPELFENDKTNILINNNNLSDIKEMIKHLTRGEDYYINVEKACHK